MHTAFMRAAHSFSADSLRDPSSRQDPSTLCLSFAINDIVYVHGLHATGWADGTLCATAERGWVPADYLAKIEAEGFEVLLDALVTFLEDPQSQRVHGPGDNFTFSETKINEIISGTKQSLDNLGALSRDSLLVANSKEVSQARKAVLTELAHVVHVAKTNKHSTSLEVISKLARGCLRLAKRITDLSLSCEHARMSLSPLPKSPKKQGHFRAQSTPSPQKQSRNSFKRPTSAAAADLGKAGPSFRPKSFLDHDQAPLPTDRLKEVANALDSYLSQFRDPEKLLNDVMSNATSATVLQLTRHCMLACRELLIVLDLHPTLFEDAKDQILESVRRLVGAARSVVAVLPPAPASLRTVALQNLVFIADGCTDAALSAARECLLFLRHTPGLKLPEDRQYPAFPTTNKDVLESYTPTLRPTRPKSPLRPNHTHRRRSSVSPVKLADTPKLEQVPTEDEITASRPATPVEEEDEELVSPSTPPRLIQSEFRSPKRSPSVPSVRQTPGKNRRTLSMPSSAFSRNLPFQVGSFEDELVYKNDKVRGGTPRALVCWLCSTDLVFEMRTFLLCFKLFTSTELVIATLDQIKSDFDCKQFANEWVSAFWLPEDNKYLHQIESLGLVDEQIMELKSQFSSETYENIEFLPLTPVDLPPPGDLPIPQSNSSKDKESSPISLYSSNSVYSLPQPPKPNKRRSRNGSMGTFAQSFRDLSLNSRKIPKSEDTDNLSEGVALILQTEPLKFAQQLTLIMFNVFKRIQPSEFLDQRFSTSKRHLNLAPHIVTLLTLSNKLSAFVGDTILSEDLTPKQRTKVLAQWIEIAHEFMDMGNYNAAITLALTLKSDRLTRLKKTWKTLSTKVEQQLEEVVPLMSHERNFSNYRKTFRTRNGPCIPFFGVLIGDLVLIDEGNPRFLESAVNFDRYLKSTKLISSIQKFQSLKFPFETDQLFQTYVSTAMEHSYQLEVKDKDEQWRRSKVIE